MQATKKKLSFKEQREMEELPGRIERMEAEQEALHARIASPEFYKEPSDDIARALARIEELKDSLHDAYARWDELDSRSSSRWPVACDEALATSYKLQLPTAAGTGTLRRRGVDVRAPVDFLAGGLAGSRRFPRAAPFRRRGRLVDVDHVAVDFGCRRFGARLRLDVYGRLGSRARIPVSTRIRGV